MPTYLCHGFRWHRQSIRVYVVVQNLDDAAPEWIIRRRSATALLESFYNLFDFLPHLDDCPATPGQGRHHQQTPSTSSSLTRASSTARPPAAGVDRDDVLGQESWSAVRLLEEYDPSRLDEVSRPYAYVADYAERIDLSASVAEVIARYEGERLRGGGKSSGGRVPLPMAGTHSDETALRKKPTKERKAGWLEKLRDQLQRGEDIRWYVVVNGDEERGWAHADRGIGGAMYRTTGFDAGQVDESEAVQVPGYSRGLATGDQRQYQHQHQHQQQPQEERRLQQMQDNDNTPGKRQHSQFQAGASYGPREHERQKLRQQLGGLNIDDSDPEDNVESGSRAPPAASEYGRRARGGSKKEMPISQLQPQPQSIPLRPQNTHGPAGPKMSMDGSQRPKTPKSGGFRRLFGRGQKDASTDSP